MQPFDVEWAATFLAVAESGGFSQAGRRLGLSQPAVHTQVKRLGEALGATLYVRRGRQIELSAEGHRVVAFARDLATERERLIADLGGRSTSRRVTLCAGEGLHLYVIGSAVRRLVTSGIPMSLLVRDAAGTRDAVLHGEADVGVLPADVAWSAPGSLDISAALTSRIRLVVPESHRFAVRSRVRIASLDGEPIVASPAGHPLRATLDAAFASCGIAPRIAIEATGWPLTLHFVSVGLGVAFANDYCTLPPGTVAISVPELEPVRVSVIRRLGARQSVEVDRVVAAVRKLG